MVHNQVEPDVVQVDLFDLCVEFGPLENFQGVAIDVENSV